MANKASNITTATTTVVSDRKSTLVGIQINKAGTSDTLTIYDNASAASGTKIATITSPVAGAFYWYEAMVKNGIVVVSGGTPGDYTVLWR